MTSDENFPKREHLLKTKDFRKAYKEGRVFKKWPVFLYAIPNDLCMNRIGLSISSRNIKLATRRNRVKRLFREAYRLNRRRLLKGFDLVLVVKQYNEKISTYKDVEKVFSGLAKESGVAA